LNPELKLFFSQMTRINYIEIISLVELMNFAKYSQASGVNKSKNSKRIQDNMNFGSKVKTSNLYVKFFP